MSYGPIPEGLQVLHKCDNPSCVRPDHLFLGTQSDNIKDSVEKGRFKQMGNTHAFRRNKALVPRGDRNGNHKLSVQEVEQIRKEYKGKGRPGYATLAHQFGVNLATIGRVIRCESWTHLMG